MGIVGSMLLVFAVLGLLAIALVLLLATATERAFVEATSTSET